jgi:Flp pilus assembly pilin Flp
VPLYASLGNDAKSGPRPDAMKNEAVAAHTAILILHTREEARMARLVARLLADEGGMETVEWGVLAALIVAAAITALTALGGNVKRQFDALVDATQ